MLISLEKYFGRVSYTPNIMCRFYYFKTKQKHIEKKKTFFRPQKRTHFVVKLFKIKIFCIPSFNVSFKTHAIILLILTALQLTQNVVMYHI